ncbi:MAG: hypothetical protein BGO70_18390 [Bacteroidetes bacterium 43-93]|mgnify:CR=1 FL=1|nr:DUF421 domain-containing protein [Bacteroidota bacterium]OJX01799.1 MAG: hypothetical protein BGO70_18390 [Bacteroidetes bacterium 43-93]
MDDVLMKLFGEGKDLTTLQMCDRGIVVFIIAFILIRISGRRSFGARTSFDNIIVILLGAVLSRAVVGVSPFVPVVASCLCIVLLHRLVGWMIAHSPRMARIIEGNKMLLYEKGEFIPGNMGKALVCREDVMQGVRGAALTDDLDKIERIYMERNGSITTIKKEEEEQ